MKASALRVEPRRVEDASGIGMVGIVLRPLPIGAVAFVATAFAVLLLGLW